MAKPTFECNDCGQKFPTASEFNDHFTRDDSRFITGCQKKPKKGKAAA